MSENFEQENLIKNLQNALNSIDEKYPDELDSENGEKCLEKLNVYVQFTMDLLNTGLHPHHGVDDASMPCAALEGTFAKVQHDFDTVRDYLVNENEIEKRAIESLSEGMIKLLLTLEFDSEY